MVTKRGRESFVFLDERFGVLKWRAELTATDSVVNDEAKDCLGRAELLSRANVNSTVRHLLMAFMSCEAEYPLSVGSEPGVGIQKSPRQLPNAKSHWQISATL